MREKRFLVTFWFPVTLTIDLKSLLVTLAQGHVYNKLG